MKRINVYVREHDYEWMTAVAKVHGRPIAEIIRRSIENYRLVEGQILGEAFVPVPDVTADDCHPSPAEKKFEIVLERMEKIEILDRLRRLARSMLDTNRGRCGRMGLKRQADQALAQERCSRASGLGPH